MLNLLNVGENVIKGKCYVLAENNTVTVWKGFIHEWSFFFCQQVFGLMWLLQKEKLGEVSKYSENLIHGLWFYPSIQIPSGYYLQTMNSNLHFSGFVLPVAVMNVISIVPLLILVPILECINSWLFSSKDNGHSPTIYIGMYKIHVFIQF